MITNKSILPSRRFKSWADIIFEKMTPAEEEREDLAIFEKWCVVPWWRVIVNTLFMLPEKEDKVSHRGAPDPEAQETLKACMNRFIVC